MILKTKQWKIKIWKNLGWKSQRQKRGTNEENKAGSNTCPISITTYAIEKKIRSPSKEVINIEYQSSLL